MLEAIDFSLTGRFKQVPTFIGRIGHNPYPRLVNEYLTFTAARRVVAIGCASSSIVMRTGTVIA
jgi:hypothetical protein